MTTPMQSNCPHCGQPHLIAPQQLGVPLRCTNCGQAFTVGGTVSHAGPMVGGTRTNGMAIASLVLGLVIFCEPVSGLLAIIFGIIGITKTKDPQVGGKGMSIAGIILGSLGMLVILPAILLPSLNRARETANRVACASNLRQIGLGLMQYSKDYPGANPPTLGVLFQTENVPLAAAICPDVNTVPPANLSGTQLAQWVDGNSDYIYIAGNQKPPALGNMPLSVLVYEKDTNHNLQGMNILLSDLSIQWFPLSQAHAQILQSNAARKSGP
jgi:hypothetical protein